MEFREDLFVNGALELDDETHDLGGRHPSPFAEFLMVVGRDVDIAILAHEAHGEPFLRLPAIASAEGAANEMPRQLISEPTAMLGDDHGLVGAGFFLELAQRRDARLLAPVDPALRHLPHARRAFVEIGRIHALAGEYEPIRIDEHDAYAGAI